MILDGSPMSDDPRPLFLVGTGRCGSTIFQSMLAMHPEVTWPSVWTELLPSSPWVAALHRIWDVPGADRFREARFFPKPAEPRATFRRHLRDPESEAASEEDVAHVRRHLRPYLQRLCRFHGKSTFLMKLVGRPVQVRLMEGGFPEAAYVDLKRDLKATVSSVLRVDFYQGWGSLEDWAWDEIPQSMREFHRGSSHSEAVGVAIGLKLNRMAIERQLDEVDPSRRILVHYSSFVEDPVGELERVLELARLPFTGRFLKRLEARQVRGGANQKWKKFLSDEDQGHLDAFQERFGY